ncbi:MAG: hypothetical protein H7Z75_10380 [Ferruginibacter sp.]|nr:hypothetical protein [Cytophagales bacterium]
MDVLENALVREFDYPAYQQRQHLETTKKQLVERARKLRKADHFALEGGQWKSLPYVGYAVVSMVDNNPGNESVGNRLREMQSRLAKGFRRPSAFFPLPPDSFHQTVANTLSNERFRQHIADKGLAADYPALLGKAFGEFPAAIHSGPIRLRLGGLSLFSSAVGVLGTFEEEGDFQRVLDFREHVYSNAGLNGLGIQRTRPFVGHVTLAYLEEELTRQEKAVLINTCVAINHELKNQALHFLLSRTELRRYQDLAGFHTEPGYPSYSFVKA